MTNTVAAKARRARRRRLTALVFALGVLWVCLAGAGWRIASRPTGTDGLIAQENMLVALYQALLAIAIVVATVFYALRTHDMAETMVTNMRATEDREHNAMIDDLVVSALAAAATAGGLAGLLRRTWTWWLPGTQRQRERLSAALMLRLMQEMSDALRARERLRRHDPASVEQTTAIMDSMLAAHDGAIRGDERETLRAAAGLRSACDDLHAVANL